MTKWDTSNVLKFTAVFIEAGLFNQDISSWNVCNATSLNLSLMVMGLWTAGLITCFLTALLVLQDNYYPNYILSAVAVGKLLFLVGCDSFSGPLWFDALEVSALVTGLWMGYYGGVKIPISPA